MFTQKYREGNTKIGESSWEGEARLDVSARYTHEAMKRLILDFKTTMVDIPNKKMKYTLFDVRISFSRPRMKFLIFLPIFG